MTPLFDRPFAHRALHGLGRPENSLQAIKAAVAGGYGIEIDVQLTADNQAIVFHDYALKRLTGQVGTVRQKTADAMEAMPLIGGMSGAPRLATVLKTVAGKVPLLIELKDQDGALGPNVGPLEDAVAAALAGYDGLAMVMSFNPHSAAALRTTGRPVGLTTCAFSAQDWPHIPVATRDRLAEIPDLAAADFISHQWDQLDSAPVHRAKAMGKPVACWTIRSPAQQETALRIADAVTFEGYLPNTL
ncbi:MAG: glycerophosphodiester phosphodiesterase family protein [Shimia sp.]